MLQTGFVISIAKSTGILTVVICINYGLGYLLGLSSDFMQHVWGILSMLIFVEGIVLHNDLKLLQERFDDLVKRYGFMQDLYNEEKLKSQQMYIMSLTDIKSGMIAINSSLSQISDSINSKSSPEHHSTNEQSLENTPCSGITPMTSLRPIPPLGTADDENQNLDYEKRKTMFKKSHSFHGMTSGMKSKKISIDQEEDIKSLYFTVELQRCRRTSSASSTASRSSTSSKSSLNMGGGGR